jgi:hypothetical protein
VRAELRLPGADLRLRGPVLRALLRAMLPSALRLAEEAVQPPLRLLRSDLLRAVVLLRGQVRRRAELRLRPLSQACLSRRLHANSMKL